MVYSGLEFGQYFELKEDEACQNVLIALNPVARMLLSMVNKFNTGADQWVVSNVYFIDANAVYFSKY
jgi:hypothetical protein